MKTAERQWLGQPSAEPVDPVRDAPPLGKETFESRIRRVGCKDHRLQARRVILGSSHCPLQPCQCSPLIVVEPPGKGRGRKHRRRVWKAPRYEALRIERSNDDSPVREDPWDPDDRRLGVDVRPETPSRPQWVEIVAGVAL